MASLRSLSCEHLSFFNSSFLMISWYSVFPTLIHSYIYYIYFPCLSSTQNYKLYEDKDIFLCRIKVGV